MGSFYSNIQIKNTRGREEFIEALNSHLLSANYEKCGKDEAELSYRLAFSEGWVTFARPEYRDQPDVLENEAKNISAAFKTKAFTTTVVDSDFAELSLYDNGEQTDYVVIGEGEAYGLDESPADPALWQPLLKPGIAFEELSAVWETDEVFCEDALYKSAPLFGIEPKFMVADDRELDDDNSVLLCFRKSEKASSAAENSAKKPAEKLTLETAFKNTFGEALEPLGFQCIKDGSFVRVIKGEILQIISWSKGIKRNTFTVDTRMITIYQVAGDNKRGYFWPVPNLSTIYTAMNPEKYDDELDRKMGGIAYDPNDGISISAAVRAALDFTMQIAIPHYQRVTDLSSYLLVNRDIGGGNSWIAKLENCRDNNYLETKSMDELLYVKTRYGGDFLEFLQSEEEFTKMVEAVKARNFSPVDCPIHIFDYSRYHERMINGAKGCRDILDKALADEELCDLIDKELERRKETNTKILTKMGIKL